MQNYNSLDPISSKIIAKELQLLSSNHAAPVYFHGKTMLPFLQEADELKVIPYTAAEVKLGDIVTYLFDDKFPTRRVIIKKNKKKIFIIKGDSINWINFKVPYENVIGLVIARKRGVKWITRKNLYWKWITFKNLFRESAKIKNKKLRVKGMLKSFKRLIY